MWSRPSLRSILSFSISPTASVGLSQHGPYPSQPIKQVGGSRWNNYGRITDGLLDLDRQDCMSVSRRRRGWSEWSASRTASVSCFCLMDGRGNGTRHRCIRAVTIILYSQKQATKAPGDELSIRKWTRNNTVWLVIVISQNTVSRCFIIPDRRRTQPQMSYISICNQSVVPSLYARYFAIIYD